MSIPIMHSRTGEITSEMFADPVDSIPAGPEFVLSGLHMYPL